MIPYILTINNYMEKIYVTFTDSHLRLVLLFRLTVRLTISIFVYLLQNIICPTCFHVDEHMTQSYIIH